MARASTSIFFAESIDDYLSVMRIEPLACPTANVGATKTRVREPCRWPYWLLAQGNGPGYCLAQGGKPRRSATPGA
jgi:hypothetical protein